jgi:hypothetical protein
MRGGRWLVIAAVVSACGGSPSAPSPDLPVTVTLSPFPVPPGSGASVAFSAMIRNRTASAVDLTFPASCEVLPHFVDRRTRQPVTPRGGDPVCATVITQISLPPQVGIARVFLIKAGETPEGSVSVLPAGSYEIYARLEDQVYHAESDRLTFDLR